MTLQKSASVLDRPPVRPYQARIAKLRATKTDTNPLLLHINMDAGHGGKAGRFARLDEIGRMYAFILWALGRAAP